MLWVVSGWYMVMIFANGACCGSIALGRVAVQQEPSMNRALSGPSLTRMRDGSSVQGARSQFLWSFERFHAGSFSLHFVPLWAPFLLSAAVTATAWRLDTLARRRARVGLCPKCGYNRIGLPPQAVCPECGAAAIVPPPSA